MGQYFVICNLDKKEIIKPNLLKLWEILANNDIRMLGFLLATKNPDGIGATRFFFNKKQKIEAIKEFENNGIEYEVHEIEKNRGYVMPKFKYLGHWCGDRIAIIGDYNKDNTLPSFDEVIELWKDITLEVVKEFNFFIEDNKLKISSPKSFMVDMLITANGIYNDKKIVK